MAAKTFAQYLVDEILPGDMHITKQVDKKYLQDIFSEIAHKYPDKFGDTVVRLKTLADKFSTYEATTMGMDEISVPNKPERDKLVAKYTKIIEDDKKKGVDEETLCNHMSEFLDKLPVIDRSMGEKDDATVMVNAAMSNKAVQLQKLRTTPGIVADHDNNPIPIVWNKSYAEGVDPVYFWLNGIDSRRNLATGQVATAKPGELSKLMNNVLCTAVVSEEDCGTPGGVMLDTKDSDVVGRYLARDAGRYKRNDVVTEDVQQALMKSGITKILVRSPQTCMCQGGAVCKKCMGIQNSTDKPYEIGTNAGVLTNGMMMEPLSQMVISAKHSAIKAKKEERLDNAEKSFRQIIMPPATFTNRKILCEVIGVIWRIRRAPQGGWLITIRQTRVVPDRYIVHAMKTPNMKMYWDYHIPPNLKLAEGIEEKAEVYPGLALSTGVDDMKDAARLRNLGALRSAETQNMYEVFKTSGNKMDRRHFELLSRNANPYVTIIRCPKNMYFAQGETVEYNKLCKAVSRMPKQEMSVSAATGQVLAEPVLDVTVGTELDAQVIKYLKENRIDKVKVVQGLEVAACFTPLNRVVNKSGDWLAGMNHRELKNTLLNAAATGATSNIHSNNPMSAFAYGVEFGLGGSGAKTY